MDKTIHGNSVCIQSEFSVSKTALHSRRKTKCKIRKILKFWFGIIIKILHLISIFT